MPGSPTALGQPGAGGSAASHVAFHQRNCAGTRVDADFAAQWLAYALPDRRFACALTDADARLGADVDRYSSIAVDLHHLLLAGLPAHSASRPTRLAKAGGHFVRFQEVGRAEPTAEKGAEPPPSGRNRNGSFR